MIIPRCRQLLGPVGRVDYGDVHDDRKPIEDASVRGQGQGLWMHVRRFKGETNLRKILAEEATPKTKDQYQQPPAPGDRGPHGPATAEQHRAVCVIRSRGRGSVRAAVACKSTH